MKHIINRKFEGNEEDGSIQDICSCGWKSKEYFNWQPYQFLECHDETMQHLIQSSKESKMITEKDKKDASIIVGLLIRSDSNTLIEEYLANIRSETLKETAARVCASCNAQSAVKFENCEQDCKYRDAVLGKDKE